ncbi:hypothetical protein [Caulobacter sp. BK020]|uniref:hypothetical protein n=1 Tax=Caulobacter sp. BK020 TaxID=2512117 RepID=UPI0010E8D7E8|nr:hypothetical protein [Caulobacter sp. BK020]TCS14931.1 hypothetical protein EV278_106118 [Caulobacter sp. BK020]
MASRTDQIAARQARRDQIVQSARDCIAGSGIYGATMADIARGRRLGVGQGIMWSRR